MNLMGVMLAATLIVSGELGWIQLGEVESFIHSFDFADLVLHGLLGLLLFAGAMFVDVNKLRTWAKPIAALATVGVLVAASIVGVLLWCLAAVIGLDLPFV